MKLTKILKVLTINLIILSLFACPGSAGGDGKPESIINKENQFGLNMNQAEAKIEITKVEYENQKNFAPDIINPEIGNEFSVLLSNATKEKDVIVKLTYKNIGKAPIKIFSFLLPVGLYWQLDSKGEFGKLNCVPPLNGFYILKEGDECTAYFVLNIENVQKALQEDPNLPPYNFSIGLPNLNANEYGPGFAIPINKGLKQHMPEKINMLWVYIDMLKVEIDTKFNVQTHDDDSCPRKKLNVSLAKVGYQISINGSIPLVDKIKFTFNSPNVFSHSKMLKSESVECNRIEDTISCTITKQKGVLEPYYLIYETHAFNGSKILIRDEIKIEKSKLINNDIKFVSIKIPEKPQKIDVKIRDVSGLMLVGYKNSPAVVCGVRELENGKLYPRVLNGSGEHNRCIPLDGIPKNEEMTSAKTLMTPRQFIAMDGMKYTVNSFIATFDEKLSKNYIYGCQVSTFTCFKLTQLSGVNIIKNFSEPAVYGNRIFVYLSVFYPWGQQYIVRIITDEEGRVKLRDPMTVDYDSSGYQISKVQMVEPTPDQKHVMIYGQFKDHHWSDTATRGFLCDVLDNNSFSCTRKSECIAEPEWHGSKATPIPVLSSYNTKVILVDSQAKNMTVYTGLQNRCNLNALKDRLISPILLKEIPTDTVTYASDNSTHGALGFTFNVINNNAIVFNSPFLVGERTTFTDEIRKITTPVWGNLGTFHVVGAVK